MRFPGFTPLLLCLTSVGALAAGQLDLRVDGLAGPAVTDDPAPRLTWAPTTALSAVDSWHVVLDRVDAPGTRREATVPVANGPWHVVDDMPLPSRSRYRWQVDAVFARGAAQAPVHAEGVFEVGLKSPGDWHAQWIALDEIKRGRAAPWFRKPFRVTKPVASARLYVSGLGWHEAWLNGARLGDGVLEPAQTDYDQRVFYVTHDVTAQLQRGDNVLGVWVGDGWYNQDRVWGPKGLSYGRPRMLAQLELTYRDGSREEIVSDPTWQAAASPVTATNVYQGEDFDARQYDPAWCTPRFDAAAWVPATVVAAPGGRMVAEPLPPCRRMRTLTVRGWTEPKPGVYVADFGQNLTGWARLHLRATPGTKVTLRFAESRGSDGTIDPLSTGIVHTGNVQTDTYVCRGDADETWEPRFTFHVFQYAELSVQGGRLLSGAPQLDTLQAFAIYNDMPVRGEFTCSDPVVQRMFELSDWTTVGNMQGLPTDCPGRERCGWTGDAHLLTPFALQRFESDALWEKYFGDILTSAAHSGQMLTFGNNFGERKVGFKAAGLPTMIAPGKRTSGAASPDWGSAIVFVPWDIYRYTGDTRILTRHYASFVQWVEHLRSIAVDNIVSNGLGDWCTPWRAEGARPSEPRAYYGRIVPELSTACYWRSTDTLARIAAAIGRQDDAAKYRQLADAIRASYVQRFFDPQRGGFADQTINAIAVNWGLLAPSQRSGVADFLSRQIAADGDHFYTGVFGLPSVFPTLADYGHQETIARLWANPAAPGFRYLLAQGATTCWEVWPTPSDEGKPYERSKSHPFQGAWLAWAYSGIAGIQVDDSAPAFRRFDLAPRMVTQLEWAKCRQQTAMGTVESSWRRNGRTMTWSVEVPPGARARVTAPGPVMAIKPLDGTPRVDPTPTGAFELPAGRYVLTIALDHSSS